MGEDITKGERVLASMKKVLTTGKVSLDELVIRHRSSGYRWTNEFDSDLCDLVRDWAHNTPLKTYQGALYIFNGKIYEEVSQKELEYFFADVLRDMGFKIPVIKVHHLFKYGYMEAIHTLNTLHPRKDIIAFRNGVVDMRSCQLYDFHPDYHVLTMKNFDFDRKAKCKKWSKFLSEVLPEKGRREILQMFLGMGLIDFDAPGSAVPAERVDLALLLIGQGANGKSVIYKTMVGLFGNDKISSLSYAELTSGSDEGMRNRSILKDMVFNWASDEDAKFFGVKNTGSFKRIVSGEPVMTRRIGGNVQTSFHLPHLVFNLNDLPYPDDTTFGFLRRLQFVYFDHIIPEADQNPHLATDLVEEYPGIFNWLMRGCQEIKRRGFKFPKGTTGRREKLLSELSNPVLAWKDAYGIRTEPNMKGEGAVYFSPQEIMRFVNRFCEDNDVEPLTQTSIGIGLRKQKFIKTRTPTGTYYKMYGVSEGMLEKPFVINDVSTDVSYKADIDTYLLETD